MRPRQPIPRLWLMTDERQGDALWTALDRLPRGAGIVFRHHGLPASMRRALYGRVAGVARRRRLLLVVAGDAPLDRSWRRDGDHGTGRHTLAKFRTAPAHNLREVRAAERAGAALIFLSPVFPTRSHPGAATLGRVRFGLIARSTPLPVIALGGMNLRRARALPGAYGWAAIDAWSDQSAPTRAKGAHALG